MNKAHKAVNSARWLKQIVRWFERSEVELPEPEFLKGEFPEWVQKVAQNLMATLFPVAKLKVGRTWTAAEVGAMAGHKLAYLHMALETPTRIDARFFKKLDRKVRAQAEKRIKSFAKRTDMAVRRSLALAAEQRYSEATSFFTAFARALSLKPVDAEASNFQRSNTRVYWLLLYGWRSVEKLRSVHELQQGLCRYLDSHVVGDIKRIEKMCQRLGLRFATRGRPRKEVG